MGGVIQQGGASRSMQPRFRLPRPKYQTGRAYQRMTPNTKAPSPIETAGAAPLQVPCLAMPRPISDAGGPTAAGALLRIAPLRGGGRHD